jgi:predicted secreted protein
MIRAIKLDQLLFDEIVSDPSSQGQSVWAMAIFAMATAFGFFGMVGGTAVNIGLITTMIAWYVWAFSVFYAGTRLFRVDGQRADRKTVLRVVAFASAPGIIRLLGIIPKSTLVILIISSIWILISATIGLKRVFPKTATAYIAAVTIGTWFAASMFQAIMIVTLLSVFGVSQSAR